MELIRAEKWGGGISINRGGYSFYLARTITERERRKGERFSGLNKSLFARVVWIKHHLGKEISIGFTVKSLAKAFYIIRGSPSYLLSPNPPSTTRGFNLKIDGGPPGAAGVHSLG